MADQSQQIKNPPLIPFRQALKLQQQRQRSGKGFGLGTQFLHGEKPARLIISINHILSTLPLSDAIKYLLHFLRDDPLNFKKCAVLIGTFASECEKSYIPSRGLHPLTQVAYRYFSTSRVTIQQNHLDRDMSIGCRLFGMTVWYLMLHLPEDVNLLLNALPILDPGSFKTETSSKLSPIIVQNISRLHTEWNACPLYSLMIMSLTFFDMSNNKQEGFDHVCVCVKIDDGLHDTLVLSIWDNQQHVLVRNFEQHFVDPLTTLTNVPLFYHDTLQVQQFRQHRESHEPLRVVIQRLICKKEPSVDTIRHNKEVLLSRELRIDEGTRGQGLQASGGGSKQYL